MSSYIKSFQRSWLLKSLAMAILLFLLLRKVEVRLLWEALRHANLMYLMLAVVVGWVMIALRVYKWQALLHRLPETLLEKKISFRQAWVSMLGGMAFGLITPARAGELGRVAFLPPVTRTLAGGLFFVDRAIDLVTILMLALVGSAGMLPSHWQILLGIVLALLVIGVLAWPVIVPWVLGWMPLPKKLHAMLNEMVEGLQALRWRDLGWNLVLGGGLMLLDVLSLYLLVATFEPVSLKGVTFAFPLILLSTLVPITPGGIGVREGTAVYLLGQFQVSKAGAFNASLLLYVVNSLLPGLWGIGYVRQIGFEKIQKVEP